MKKRLWLVLLAGITLVGCDSTDPNSPVGKRKAIFKHMMATSEDLGGMLRGRIPFDGQAFIKGAQHLDGLSHQPWEHFAHIDATQKTSARDDVWQRQERFDELARDMEAATAALVEATQATPLRPSGLRPAMQRVEDACEGCHKEFRAY